MQEVIDKAIGQLWSPYGLSETTIDRAFDALLAHKVDYGDCYFQQYSVESFYLEDSIIKNGQVNFDQGVGLRAIFGETTGFAYTDDLNENSIVKAAGAANSIVSHGQAGQRPIWTPATDSHQLYVPTSPFDGMSQEAKVALLREADQCARQADTAVRQVMVSMTGLFETIMVLGSDGTWSADQRPLVRFNVTVIVEKDGKTETATAGGGGRYDYHYFTQNDLVKHYAHEAVRKALLNVEAIPAPAGTMTVVLGSGWPGVLLHEAVGHGLEGDFNRKGTSAYSGLIGEQVASSLCTIVDDGTIANRRGSLNIDDEGTPTGRTVLIEDGILRGYMQDKHNASLMKCASTGNGRRESYSHLPMPRMTNTFMLPGQNAPQEIIESVESGIYAVNFGGGSVDITSGQFVFSANEAYKIENGKVTVPIKGATLIGNGPDAMRQVTMVGNDLALDEGVGVCGKSGQSVPVGVGQPTLRLDNMTVGGTQA